MKIKSKKIRNRNYSKKIRNKHYNRKSIKRNRNRKSNKNNRLKKYGGVRPHRGKPTHIFITYYGENYYEPDGKAGVYITIQDLIDSKEGIFNLYHRGILLSTYPLNARVIDALPSDGEPGYYNYNIQVTKIIEGEEPPKTIDIAKINPNIVMPDPYDDGYW